MSDYDPNRTPVVSSSSGGFYFIVGMLVAAVLVGVYILMGTPGLHTQVAHAPGSGQKIDVATPPVPPERPPRATPR